MSEGTAKSGSPPNGYHPLPAGFACKCVQVWQDGKGNYWCCRPVAVEMPGSDPGKANHAEFASVQPASAAMPSEEEIHAAFVEAQRQYRTERDANLAKQGYWPDRSPAPLDFLAKVAHALFAPILAEKERQLASFRQYVAMHRARALAAEAALAAAIVFELGERHYVESRGDGTWAIKNDGCVLNVDGVWEYEPSPSNRTDEFIARTRFDRDDAFRRAAAIRAQGE